MLIRFKRKHRFFRSGQVIDIPEKMAISWVKFGIVTEVEEPMKSAPTGGRQSRPQREARE